LLQPQNPTGYEVAPGKEGLRHPHGFCVWSVKQFLVGLNLGRAEILPHLEKSITDPPIVYG
jgi:hypothetical protein